MFKALLVFSLFVQSVRADDTQLVHFLAHAGSSYVLTVVGTGILEKWVGLPRTKSWVIAGIAALAIGMAYKYSEPGLTNDSLLKATSYNLVGIGGAIATIEVFKF